MIVSVATPTEFNSVQINSLREPIELRCLAYGIDDDWMSGFVSCKIDPTSDPTQVTIRFVARGDDEHAFSFAAVLMRATRSGEFTILSMVEGERVAA